MVVKVAALRAPLFLAAGALAVCSCSTWNTGRYVQSEAFERCRDLTGAAQERCLDQEEDRVSEQLAEDNQRCLDEIEKQRERTAMRKGEQAGRTGSTAASGC